ncbi:unnamed protein product, partial [Rotaria socialis]
HQEGKSIIVGCDISKEIGLRWKKVSDDSTKRYAQKAAVEKQKYEVCHVEYKKGGDDVSSAKGGKAAAKAPASKKPASKSKSSDEDNDDDDDNENEDEDEDEE